MTASASLSRSLSRFYIIFSLLTYTMRMRRVPHSFKFILYFFLHHTYFCNMRQQMFSIRQRLISLVVLKKGHLKNGLREQTKELIFFFVTKLSYFTFCVKIKILTFLWVCWKHSTCTSSITWTLSWLHFTLHHPLPYNAM